MVIKFTTPYQFTLQTAAFDSFWFEILGPKICIMYSLGGFGHSFPSLLKVYDLLLTVRGSASEHLKGRLLPETVYFSILPDSELKMHPNFMALR